MNMFKHIKKEKGSTLITILITLVIIELIAIALITSITVSNQANSKSTKNIIAYRFAESKMEETIKNIKDSSLIPPYTSSEIYNEYKLITNISQETDNLFKITIQVQYDFSYLNGEIKTQTMSLESLVNAYDL